MENKELPAGWMWKKLGEVCEKSEYGYTTSAKSENRKIFGQISAFICVHLRLISVSLSDRSREIQFELFWRGVENDSTTDGILRGEI